MDDAMIKIRTKEYINDIELEKVIIQDKGGRIFEGYTDNFSPSIPCFHIFQRSDESTYTHTKVYFDGLKLIFFEHDHEDIPFDNDDEHLPINQISSGRKLEITFHDGEVIIGTWIDCSPNNHGFFLLTDGNNITKRVFVCNASIRKIDYCK
jgi:hypothetical protein